MAIRTLDVDLGNSGCHIVDQDQFGNQVTAKQLSNKKFAEFLAQLPPCRVLFESCGSTHHCARKVVFRILCHFFILCKKEMTYDDTYLRHGSRTASIA